MTAEAAAQDQCGVAVPHLPPTALGRPEEPAEPEADPRVLAVIATSLVRRVLSADRLAVDPQMARRTEAAERELRLEELAVAMLTALGERDAVVRETERRAGVALGTMTTDEGLSVGEAVE